MKTITIISTLSAVVLLASCQKKQEEVKTPGPRPLLTYQVMAESKHVARHFTGVAKASEEVTDFTPAFSASATRLLSSPR